MRHHFFKGFLIYQMSPGLMSQRKQASDICKPVPANNQHHVDIADNGKTSHLTCLQMMLINTITTSPEFADKRAPISAARRQNTGEGRVIKGVFWRSPLKTPKTER